MRETLHEIQPCHATSVPRPRRPDVDRLRAGAGRRHDPGSRTDDVRRCGYVGLDVPDDIAPDDIASDDNVSDDNVSDLDNVLDDHHDGTGLGRVGGRLRGDADH
jgi:hypothetical protein